MFIENYSDVLFEQATESKKSLKSVFSNCKKFSDYLVTDKILISTLNNVGIDVTKRKELIQEILKIFHLEYFTYTV
jgi:F0F1-type ATP synthase delta subunit